MRPLSPAAARILLGVVVAGFAALALNASLLLPLWEPADEYEHWLVVEHWARHGAMPDLRDKPMLALNEGVQPPLAYGLFALGAHALGIADTDFLARRVDRNHDDGPAYFLHGADELFPFAGPARALHVLRLFDVLCGVAVVCGAYALVRRLAPQQPGVALGAAALVAFNPAFVALCGAISNDPLAIALGTAALVSLARLVRHPAPTLRTGLAVGALIGLAHMAKLSATFLLPLVPLALLLRRPRGEPWRVTLHLLDGIVAGFVPVTGLYVAWNLAHYGDPFGWSVIAAKFGGQRAISTTDAMLLRFLPEVGVGYVARLSSGLLAGAWVVLAWAAVAALAPLWYLLAGVFAPWRRRLRASGVDGRVALLCGVGVLVNLAAATKYFLDFNQPFGRYLYPTLPALAGLVALGWCWLPRPLAAAGVLALALLCFRTQVHELGPAFAVPQRAADPHFMCFDPLANVDDARRLRTLRLSEPADGSRLADAPTLRWALPADPETRFTVHLRTPGLAPSLRTWEDFGVSSRDRLAIPDALWEQLPPDVPLIAQVIELPTLDQALGAGDGALDVLQSAEITLRRRPAPAR